MRALLAPAPARTRSTRLLVDRRFQPDPPRSRHRHLKLVPEGVAIEVSVASCHQIAAPLHRRLAEVMRALKSLQTAHLSRQAKMKGCQSLQLAQRVLEEGLASCG